MGSKGTGKPEEMDQFPLIHSLLDQILEEDTCLTIRDLAVNGRDLMRLGIPAGKKLGEVLQSLLEAVLDETLPNEKNALLEAAEALRIDSGSRM
jgi:tRNA nucleotidyltransferase/poly(A) polymerase